MMEWNFCSSSGSQTILSAGRSPNEKEEGFGTSIADNRECRFHKLNRITKFYEVSPLAMYGVEHQLIQSNANL